MLVLALDIQNLELQIVVRVHIRTDIEGKDFTLLCPADIERKLAAQSRIDTDVDLCPDLGKVPLKKLNVLLRAWARGQDYQPALPAPGHDRLCSWQDGYHRHQR